MSAATLRARLDRAGEFSTANTTIAELGVHSDPPGEPVMRIVGFKPEAVLDVWGHCPEDLRGALEVVELVLTLRRGFIRAKSIPAEDLVAQAVAAGESQNAYAALMEAVVAFEALP